MPKPIKLLVYNDPHFSLTAPSSRTNSYPLDVLRKLNEVNVLAKKLCVDYRVSSGDNFNLKDKTTHEETRLMIKVQKSSNIPLIGIGGNHDYAGYNFNSRKRRALGVLEEAGSIRMLDMKPIIKNSILITGSSHNHSYDINRHAYFKTHEQEKFFTVAITHGSLILDRTGTFWGNYTNMSNLEDAKDAIPHNIIINGHLHHPQKEYLSKKKDLKCFAIGSITRNILKEDVAKRIPRVLYLEIKDGSCRFEEIELKTARKASEVFLDIDAAKSIPDSDIESFVHSLLDKTSDLQEQGNKHLIRRIVLKKKYPKEIEMKVLNYLEQKGCYDNTH